MGLEVSWYLIKLSMIPAVLLVGFIIASIVGLLVSKPNFSKLMTGLAITVGGYFIGTLVGHIYMGATEGHGDESHAAVVAYDQGDIQLVAMTLQDEEKDAEQDDNEAEQGGEKAEPEQGGEKAEPEQGGEKAAPEQGGEKAAPEQGGEGEAC